jgi:transcription initiation factor TFIIIB Brf1 subunit/transcription initiation factor TFIIB
MALGSYLGSAIRTPRERASRGLADTHSSFVYLKKVSDFVGRDDGTLFECVKMVERVCERLSLPNVVMARAVIIARKVLGSRNGRKRTTIAAISAFSIIASSRIGRGGSVSTREVIEAHRALGRALKVSSIIQLSLESKIRIEPRKPEDYVPRVLARLSSRTGMEGKSGSPSGAGRTQQLHGLAIEILAKVPEELKAGHRPCSLAATAVYAAELALAEREGRSRSITQREVAECGDTAEYTVREQYREIISCAIRPARVQTPPQQVRP